jgi:hypothetical protein
MKKQATFIAVVFFAIILSVTGQSFAAEKAGEVLAVKENVYILRGESRNNAEPKMDIQTKDAVMTDKDSRTKLFFIDDSILNLGELSKVEVEEYLYDSELNRSKSIYKLIDGSLRVVVGRSNLEVHTETAVAAARGTKFIIWNEDAGSTASSKKADDKVLLASSDGQFMAVAEDDRDKPKTHKRTCIIVLDGKVLLKNKKDDVEGKLMVDEGNAGCVAVDSPPNIERGLAANEGAMYVYGKTRGSDPSVLAAFVEPERPAPEIPEVLPEDIDQTIPSDQVDPLPVEPDAVPDAGPGESDINVELRFNAN